MRRSPILATALLAALLVGFNQSAAATEARYACAGQALDARFSAPGTRPGEVTLTFADGRTITLPQVMSADGGRYASGDMEFWIKGRNATLTRSGTAVSCTGR